MDILNSVTIRHVKKYYGSGNSQVKALDGVDLSVAQGSSSPLWERRAAVRRRF